MSKKRGIEDHREGSGEKRHRKMKGNEKGRLLRKERGSSLGFKLMPCFFPISPFECYFREILKKNVFQAKPAFPFPFFH